MQGAGELITRSQTALTIHAIFTLEMAINC